MIHVIKLKYSQSLIQLAPKFYKNIYSKQIHILFRVRRVAC